MQPFKRRRRTRRDMIVLGGWLFADLLLGLAMLFLVANTVGSAPATPTPTPEPDYLATATIEFGQQQASNEETIAALEGDIAQADLSAGQTADASSNQQREVAAQATEEAIAAQTEQAMDEGERATFAAESTAAAVDSQSTINAISTEQADNQSASDQASIDLATSAAQATEIADSVNAQSTEQADLAAVATENAATGANSQGTVVALETSQAENQSAQATSDANASNAQSTADALESRQANIDSTIAALEQEAQSNTLNPQSVTETISVDVNGILAEDQTAIDSAVDELNGVLIKYVEGANCKIGFANIATNSPDVGIGSQTSEALGELIQTEFPTLLLEIEGQEPTLAFESIANVGAQPEGDVTLQLFINFGCTPTG